MLLEEKHIACMALPKGSDLNMIKALDSNLQKIQRTEIEADKCAVGKGDYGRLHKSNNLGSTMNKL
jgi:hypothetical protein